jgi:hypothetical protein
MISANCKIARSIFQSIYCDSLAIDQSINVNNLCVVLSKKTNATYIQPLIRLYNDSLTVVNKSFLPSVLFSL